MSGTDNVKGNCENTYFLNLDNEIDMKKKNKNR